MYITLADIKKHLNIDFSDDDTYLTSLIGVAEDYIATYCNRPITELCNTVGEGDEATLVLRDAAKHAIRLLVGHWYNSREAVSFAAPSQVPFGVAALLVPLKKF